MMPNTKYKLSNKGLYPAPLFFDVNGRGKKTVASTKDTQQAKSVKSGAGFTLIELLAVITITVILATAMVINLAGQRAARDVKIAQNQLVSYIRQAQSYTLSARTLPSGESVQFYVLKFDLATPTQYTLQAIYNASSNPQLRDIQTINLPPNIQIASATPAAYPIVIDRSPANDSLSSQNFGSNDCALVAFAAPFGKVIFNRGCNRANWDANSDDYEKIDNFQTNVPCASPGVPPSCSASTDSIMTITLTNTQHTVSKTVTVNAITGAVIFN